MHRIGVSLFFLGGEMAANSCAAEIGQARLLGKTGSASKAESACELCVFLGIQKICAKIHKYKFQILLCKTLKKILNYKCARLLGKTGITEAEA